jgi:hypothetical protein
MSRMPAVKNVGEPCAGEPHARFDVAAGGNQTSRANTRRAVQAPLADPTAPHRREITSGRERDSASTVARMEESDSPEPGGSPQEGAKLAVGIAGALREQVVFWSKASARGPSALRTSASHLGRCQPAVKLPPFFGPTAAIAEPTAYRRGG